MYSVCVVYYDIYSIHTCNNYSCVSRNATAHQLLWAIILPLSRTHALFTLQGTTQYLVLWEGYRRDEASWVVEEEITEAAIRYDEGQKYNF